MKKNMWRTGLIVLLLLFTFGCKEIVEKIPSIAKILPGYGLNSGPANIVIQGTNFQAGAMVKLLKNGAIEVTATSITVSSETEIKATLNLTGLATGSRDVLVENSGGKTATLANGFQVLKPTVLYVAGYYDRKISIFHSADTYSGAQVPDRVISPLFNPLPQVSGLFLDNGRNVLYVCWPGQYKVLVFDNAATANGSVAPNRQFTSSGLLNQPWSCRGDAQNNLLYVASQGNNTIYVYASAASADGNLVPIRSIISSAIQSPTGLFIDMVNNRLYVANSGASNCSISVFDNLSGLNGSVLPSRTITSSDLSPYLYDVFVDTSRNVLYAAVSNGKKLLVYKNAGAVNGAITPDVVVTMNYYPKGLFVDTDKDLLFISHSSGSTVGTGSILVFENASTLTSASSPARIISNLTGPMGMWGTNE